MHLEFQELQGKSSLNNLAATTQEYETDLESEKANFEQLLHDAKQQLDTQKQKLNKSEVERL